MTTSNPPIYTSLPAATHTVPSASTAYDTSDPRTIKSFHTSLPDFSETPLHDLPALASQLGIGNLFVKSESSRLGLPAFKILGASWATYKALCQAYNMTANPSGLTWQQLRDHIHAERVKSGTKTVLYAATDGNHGRAVARMAKLLLSSDHGEEEELPCAIYVPTGMYETTKQLIRGEGAEVVTVNGDYDEAVKMCFADAMRGTKESSGNAQRVMVQDNMFEGYAESAWGKVPEWIVDGYQTMLREVDESWDQMITNGEVHGQQITHVVTPIGVGSLGNAVVNWAKSADRKKKVRVIAVEPETAACLYTSLQNRESTVIEAKDTIMSGMCCGTVSPTSWPVLRDGVDASVTVSDWECHEQVVELETRYNIVAGPCGAGCLRGLRKVLADRKARKTLAVNAGSVIVVLSTEGKRDYPVPQALAH